jgi:hypothetical protein
MKKIVFKRLGEGLRREGKSDGFHPLCYRTDEVPVQF